MNASDKFLEIVNHIKDNANPFSSDDFEKCYIFKNYTLKVNKHGEYFLNENLIELGNINIDGTNSLQNEFKEEVDRMNRSYDNFKIAFSI